MTTNPNISDYPCTSCGLCCRIVGEVVDQFDKVEDPRIRQALIDFPYKTINGVCEMLASDNTCKVYESRPDICNIKTMAYLKGFNDKDITEYYKINATICNSWIQLNKLDPSFLIPTEQFQ